MASCKEGRRRTVWPARSAGVLAVSVVVGVMVSRRPSAETRRLAASLQQTSGGWRADRSPLELVRGMRPGGTWCDFAVRLGVVRRDGRDTGSKRVVADESRVRGTVSARRATGAGARSDERVGAGSVDEGGIAGSERVNPIRGGLGRGVRRRWDDESRDDARSRRARRASRGLARRRLCLRHQGPLEERCDPPRLCSARL